MTVGKEIGEFDMKTTSITFEPGKGDYLTAPINFAGDAPGEIECRALATMTVESRNGKDGDYKICARCFLADGEILDAAGEGKTLLDGKHNWQVAGIAEVAGQRTWAVQGTIDLEKGAFVGKMFERT